MNPRTRNLKLPLIAAAVLASLATAALSIQPPQDTVPTKSTPMAEFSTAALHVEPSIEIVEPGSDKALASSELQAFFAKHSTDWTVSVDTRSGLPHLIQGAGFPLIPGKGNSLTRDHLKLEAASEPRLEDVAGLLKSFMTENAGLLGAGDHELELDFERSLGYGERNHFWSVELKQHYKGVPVEGAHVFFRVSHGNVIQLGTNKVADIVDLDVVPSVSGADAFQMAFAELGITAEVDGIVDRGSLKIFPALAGDGHLGELYKSAAGFGYRHFLVWEFHYRLVDDDHAYKLLVDAHTGALLEYMDLTRYAQVTANVYPVTNTDALITVGLPSATVTNSGTKITDSNGNYTYSGDTATVQLNGRYTSINDNCGNISLADSSDGNLDFGGAGGTDCTTPGTGGNGNTHSARTGFYHLTNINRTAASFLPGNTWLDGTLTANMNINSNCNAYWNGSSVNFYTSGGGCANTGEIAAVFLHEWGHGMDSNAGGSAGENGTGEAIGDSFAFIELREPCIGENFLSTSCYNCNSSCTGVRDVSAYAIGGISTVARPSTVEDNAGMNCDRLIGDGNTDCPYIHPTAFVPYQGPMGYEGHCESYIASSANWDLAQMLIAEHGTEGGWGKMEELWYGIMTPMGSAYRVASGGQCNPSASVDGCGSSNWYTLYLAADDDDGNLANGTPNGCRIWDAFDAHGIACGTRPTCSTTCTPDPIADAGTDRSINEGNSTTIGTAAQSDHSYSWSPGGATSAQVSVSPTTTTVYTVTATTSCGSAQDSVTVTVIPAGSGGPQDAVWSGTHQAPACLTVGSSCDTNALVDGVADAGPEPNQPNTIADSCADGTSGSYHSDESNDRVVVSTLDSGDFSEGDTVQIDATVYAWSTGADDTLDLYYAADATSPSWVFITSLSPSSGGAQTLSAQYTLPSGALQAVRAQFRYQGSAGTCTSGNYNDRDDLVFAVETAGGCTSDGQCDNGLWCDGAETCNLGTGLCEDGAAPNCSDGVSCTVDSCNEGSDSCDNVTDDGACDNGLWCDGAETCNATLGCQSGSAPNCSDGVSCTVDSCNEGSDSCDNVTDDGACDNGLWCDGAETCNATLGCQAGTDPCSGSQTCNETTDICESGGGGGPQDAVYDAGLGAPACAATGSECDSLALLDGRGSVGPEPNQPNTIDSCADGTSGSYHSDESNDRIVVKTLDGSDFAAGATVQVEATVYGYSTGSSDHLDLYYAADAGSPSWTLITTIDLTAGGVQTLSAQYTLPSGSLQAVRANFRYNGSQSSCSGGSYDDTDDLVFAVGGGGGGGGCTTDDDFEGGAAGWTTSGTCSTGTFVLGTPTQQTSTIVTQVGGDHTTGSGSALFTATNTAAGSADVDGGECAVTSPVYNVTDASDLSVWYFHGQRDTGDDASGDYYVLEASVNGGAYSSFVSIGDVRTVAAWTNATTTVPAGSTVQLRVRVSDGTSGGDIIEGGIDDLSICPQ